MISNRETQIPVQSTINGDRVAMGIDPAAMAHIMNVLTDLYSDPEQAVIREYSTNAHDAQIEAGVKRPIEVTTPTPLAPFFTVKDYGIGLSVEDIHNIYSQYGASTKRNTNDQVGMLGLGCKSALTYANQFTVVGIKGGVRVQVVVSRDESGGGSMTVVETSTTTDPDGTEVQVPVRRSNQIEEKCNNFFRFWPKGSVLINGKEAPALDSIPVTDNIAILPGDGSYYDKSSYIVMGNVPYPVTIRHGLNHGAAIVAWVPIGSVDFPPNRESLMDTETTRATMSNVEQAFKSALPAAINRTVQDARNLHYAFIRSLEWAQTVPHAMQPQPWTYKGQPLLSKVDGDFTVLPGNRYRVLSRSSKVREVHSAHWPTTMFIKNYDRPTFTPGQRKKINYYGVDQGNLPAIPGLPSQYVLCHGAIPAELVPYILPEQVWDWKDIQAVKLPRNAPTISSGRIPGSYDLYHSGTHRSGVAGDDVAKLTEPLFYTSGSHPAYHYNLAFSQWMPKGYVLVTLSANRVDKFRRLFPQAIDAHVQVEKLYKEWTKSVPKDALAAWTLNNLHYGLRGDLLRLDTKKVDDPALKEAVRLLTIDLTSIDHQRKLFRQLGIHGNFGGQRVENPLTKYPLFDSSVLRRNPDHVYHYLNAAYAAKKGAK